MRFEGCAITAPNGSLELQTLAKRVCKHPGLALRLSESCLQLSSKAAMRPSSRVRSLHQRQRIGGSAHYSKLTPQIDAAAKEDTEDKKCQTEVHDRH